MKREVLLQELGEGIDKAVVACWHFREGDTVGADDDVCEVVTDKASFNMPSGVEGKIKEILVKEGEEAKVGQALAVVG